MSGKLRMAIWAALAISVLPGCQSSRAQRAYHEGYVATDQQKAEFLVNELIPETKVVVCVGESASRKEISLEEQFERLPEEKRTKEVRNRFLFDKQQVHYDPMRVLIFSHALLLKDATVAPNHSSGVRTSTTFKTNSRFIQVRVEFPEDGDAKEVIVDISKGWFLLFGRAGEYFSITQFDKEPSLD